MVRAQISLLELACHKAHVCKSSWLHNGSKKELKLTPKGQVKRSGSEQRTLWLHDNNSNNKSSKISNVGVFIMVNLSQNKQSKTYALAI